MYVKTAVPLRFNNSVVNRNLAKYTQAFKPTEPQKDVYKKLDRNVEIFGSSNRIQRNKAGSLAFVPNQASSCESVYPGQCLALPRPAQ
jgi:hypothetical protein